MHLLTEMHLVFSKDYPMYIHRLVLGDIAALFVLQKENVW